MPEIQTIKISELPETSNLNGLRTLGTTADNQSVAAQLQAVADATANANDAATQAQEAAQTANEAAQTANAATASANQATDNVIDAINKTEAAYTNATAAAESANEAAAAANSAADQAISFINSAQTAVDNANTAAYAANEAATTATNAANNANTQAEYAKEQGDYAKQQGDAVLAQKGQPNGLAELDSTGRVPAGQLPGFVDDVINVDTYNDLPNPGEDSKIYITIDTNLQYRWGGESYVILSPSLALGTTSETAGRGDWTQAAYNHSLITDGSNPHKTTFSSLPDANSAIESFTNSINIGGVNLINGSSNPNSWADYTKFNDGIFELDNASSNENFMSIQGIGELYSDVQYTISFEVKSTENLSSAEIYFLIIGNQNQDIISKLFYPTTEWTKVVLTFTPSISGNRYIRFDNNGSTDGNVASLFVKNVMFEFGNKATTYWPSPSDIISQSYILDMDNILDVIEGSSSTVTSANQTMLEAIRSSVIAGNMPRVFGKEVSFDTSILTGVSYGVTWQSTIVAPMSGSTTNVLVGLTAIVPSQPQNKMRCVSFIVSTGGNIVALSDSGWSSVGGTQEVLNIPASGEQAATGWTYNGKQVYVQRFSGSFTGAAVTNQYATVQIPNLSFIVMRNGTVSFSNNIYEIGDDDWNIGTGESTIKSNLKPIYGSSGSVQLHIYDANSNSGWQYEFWLAYTK